MLALADAQRDLLADEDDAVRDDEGDVVDADLVRSAPDSLAAFAALECAGGAAPVRPQVRPVWQLSLHGAVLDEGGDGVPEVGQRLVLRRRVDDDATEAEATREVEPEGGGEAVLQPDVTSAASSAVVEGDGLRLAVPAHATVVVALVDVHAGDGDGGAGRDAVGEAGVDFAREGERLAQRDLRQPLGGVFGRAAVEHEPDGTEVGTGGALRLQRGLELVVVARGVDRGAQPQRLGDAGERLPVVGVRAGERGRRHADDQAEAFCRERHGDLRGEAGECLTSRRVDGGVVDVHAAGIRGLRGEHDFADVRLDARRGAEDQLDHLGGGTVAGGEAQVDGGVCGRAGRDECGGVGRHEPGLVRVGQRAAGDHADDAGAGHRCVRGLSGADDQAERAGERSAVEHGDVGGHGQHIAAGDAAAIVDAG